MFLKILLFLVMDEWNNLKPGIRYVGTYLTFRKLILNLGNGRPISNPIYNIFNPVGLKYLTPLRLQ